MSFWRFGGSHARTLPETCFAPSPHVVAAVHDADTALLDMRTERYYTLDAVGTRIWEMLGAGQSMDEIATHLADEFDAPLAVIDADLRALLAKLQSASLIIPSSGVSGR